MMNRILPHPLGVLLFLAAALTGVQAAGRYVGPSRCIRCHRREGEVWKGTKHFQSFFEIEKHPKTRNILEAVGDSSVTGSKVCATCHLTVVEDRTGKEPPKAVSGPSCEKCHGPASEWMPIHADLAAELGPSDPGEGKGLARRRAAHEKGMLDHTKLFDVSSKCMACHGLNHPDLDGETMGKLLGAGHPIEPSYELVEYFRRAVAHRFYPVPGGTGNQPRSPVELARMFVIGQVARLLSAHNAVTRSEDAGYQAAQKQREELSREALIPLSSCPSVAEFLADPTEDRARRVATEVETMDATEPQGPLSRIARTYAAEVATSGPPVEVKSSWGLTMPDWLHTFPTRIVASGARAGLLPDRTAPEPVVEVPLKPVDAAAAGLSPAEEKVPSNADEALERLLAGNLRFVAERSRDVHESRSWRKTLTGGQHPFAAVLSCADSRVPVELVFDQGFGDLFVIRVAGNVYAPDTAGSVLYAVHHLETKLLFVMGHEACGAVTAALDFDPSHSEEPRMIRSVLGLLAPAVKNVPPSTPPEHRLFEAIKENVRLTIRKLREDPEIRHAEEHGGLEIVGGVYEISTGKVFRILE